ncbi:PEP-CTERM sorting domain-containing protein [Albitalea terrae]|uniref:PEP-CTERM sorting domain-containing protein n=1 Tax=Piscinibacter terrae TaxID=2496871 RepID=A0A3N7IYZ9_9BURK|nr:esterase-like activity of phytase family protein [Albitalea terrae]RQP23952.1 PEP-CTERM sorting domain-containing protein [Albitalea terrae]
MTSFPSRLSGIALAGVFALMGTQAHAIQLIAQGNLSGQSLDMSGLSGTLENGLSASLAGGLGSGLAWAGGNTFIGIQDRGPNAKAWNSTVDDTTSFIGRFQTLKLELSAAASGSPLPYTLTPTLTGTTLLSSPTALNYGTAPAPSINSAGKNYFTGRSDAFGAGLSTNPNDARLDPEAARVSKDGKSVFVSDEYGPYVYQFDRATGQRIRTFALPDMFAIANKSSQGAVEIATNATGRVTNKGMEGLAITPDGKYLVGFMQSPLAQDGGDGGAANRIVKIEIATGKVTQFAYNNTIAGKNYNSSEIVALNDHEFLVLERDGKGLGDGSKAVVKQVWKVDIAGADDVSALSGAAALLAKAPSKTLFLDIKAALNAAGIADDRIPAKLESLAFGEDVMVGGKLQHTLYIANDNDFLGDVLLSDKKTSVSYGNQFFVFGFGDADLGGSAFVPQQITAVPEPETYALMLAGLGLVGWMSRRRRG